MNLHERARYIPLELRLEIIDLLDEAVSGNWDALTKLFTLYRQYFESEQDIHCDSCRGRVTRHWGILVAQWTSE